MLGRFDMMIEVPEVPIHALSNPTKNENSAEIIARITAARNLASRRRSQKYSQGNILLSAGLMLALRQI